MVETLSSIRDLIWGPPLLILLAGTGLYLTVILKGVQFRYLAYAIGQVFTAKPTGRIGDITPFDALMTSLAGAIGTGSIVGVATAITVGGFGSIFWMWIAAFFGMATKYAESLLAVRYRVMDKRGEIIGGPMQYIEKGVGLKWLAVAFAIFGAIAALTTGNLVQVNAIAESMTCAFSCNPLVTGGFIALFSAIVIMGGVKSIGRFASYLVPFMGLLYVGGGGVILALYYDRLPEAFSLIFRSAFTGQAAMGALAGGSVIMAIQHGVARSIFSNEAGLGISSISAAAAQTDSAGRQAMISMTGAIFSTMIVCTITALVLAVTEAPMTGATGATMALQAFESALKGGHYVVVIGLVLFAYSTILAWAYYGEKCFEYLFGEKSVLFYRAIFCFVLIPGALLPIDFVWVVADITNGLMVIPNLIALLYLGSEVVTETDEFLIKVEAGKGAL